VAITEARKTVSKPSGGRSKERRSRVRAEKMPKARGGQKKGARGSDLLLVGFESREGSTPQNFRKIFVITEKRRLSSRDVGKESAPAALHTNEVEDINHEPEITRRTPQKERGGENQCLLCSSQMRSKLLHNRAPITGSSIRGFPGGEERARAGEGKREERVKEQEGAPRKVMMSL